MIAFAALFITVAIVFRARVDEWVVIVNCSVVIALVLGIVWVRAKRERKAAQIVHSFYIFFLPPVFFKASEYLSYPIHGRDYDHLLIMVDRMMFGVDPTVWMFQNLPTYPFFVEFLQLSYSMFYVLPLWLGIELYRRRIRKDPEHHFHDDEPDELEQHRFIMIYGFCFSYLGYTMLPAIGPRFYLHDFWSISTELPGLLFTEALRTLTNAGENVEPYMTHAEAMKIVTRDAFPSGHTMMTLVTMILAFRYRARARWIMLFIGSSLIFSTVYLRYHYVVDLIGGAVAAMLVLYTWRPLSEILDSTAEQMKSWRLFR